MGKRASAILLTIALIFSTTAVYAESQDLMGGMFNKCERGIVDLLSFWVEIPAQVVKGYYKGFAGDEHQKILGASVGIFTGTHVAIGRALSGAGNLISFWAANPASNDNIGVPFDAKLAWEEGEPYDLFYPSFTEATIVPTGNKLLRGVNNLVFGIAEIPGQILKGINEGEPATGLIKGFWYWGSREVQGIIDIISVFHPNHEHHEGVAFDEENAWDALFENMPFLQ
jgi:putative exosortase-associated protein (TIGR04073 family)